MTQLLVDWWGKEQYFSVKNVGATFTQEVSRVSGTSSRQIWGHRIKTVKTYVKAITVT